MPGIFVDRRDEDLIQVKTPYYEPYIKRLRRIDGATWGGDDDQHWLLPIESAEDLDEEFFGELIYVTPRHELLEIKSPKPPKIFKEVPRVKIKNLKMTPYEFQEFGANFLVHSMKKNKLSMLGDLMGCGKTLQSIMAAMQLKQEGLVKKVLVVVLAPTRLQWQKEVAKFTHERAEVFADFKATYRKVNGKSVQTVSIEEKKKAFLQEFQQGDAMFLITSYQGLQQNEGLLEACDFDFVICSFVADVKPEELLETP